MSENDKATHVYCDACETIRPADQQPLDMMDQSGQFVGGDLLCGVCFNVITTVYRELSETERQARGIETIGRAFSGRPGIKGRA
jgi:hypothetical protein